MVQAVSGGLLAMKVRDQSQASFHEVFDGQSRAGKGYFSEYLGFPLSATFQQCSMLIHSSITYAKETQQMTVSLNNIQQFKRSTYNITPRRVRETTVAVEKE